MKPSDIFEGEESGLIQAFNEAVSRGEEPKDDCAFYHPVGILCDNPGCTGGLGVFEESSTDTNMKKLTAQERKDSPVFSGVIQYFPDALWYLAVVSKKGNSQHNPGKPLHWDRSKSGDELEALTRHLFEAGTDDDDGIKHSGKLAWRAMSNLQKELEKSGEAFISKIK